MSRYIACPTTYQTRHFFNNSKTNEDIATKLTHTTDTFLFISHTTNVLLFKSRCNNFIGFRIIKEMPGLVGSGTPCIMCFPTHTLVTTAAHRSTRICLEPQSREAATFLHHSTSDHVSPKHLH